MNENFKAGFINIIGKPNAGKSTLLNLLVGERLAAITAKAQTTRRRILGIVTTDDYQIIYSDTPGIIDAPEYKLHEWMNAQIQTALEDADIILYITTPGEPKENNPTIEKLKKTNTPVFIVINKTDLVEELKILEEIKSWDAVLPGKKIIPVSALKNKNISTLQKNMITDLPVHPPYYETDELTDQTERAIVAEMVREKILEQYQQEIPYSAEVVVEEFKEKETITVIRAVIYVTKDSHKNIIIGNKGSAIKSLGTGARKNMEAWLGRKVFLELFVKVKENWKNDDRMLKHFGYE
ncbi:MAG: GTPase Era [Chitinophagales bacterium]|nr:GTPase Era [Chitinophagales bacterium]